MTCEYCTDGDGICVFPYYGLAPHKHVGDSMIGSTMFLDKTAWPENFVPDEDEGAGIYAFCPECKGARP